MYNSYRANGVDHYVFHTITDLFSLNDDLFVFDLQRCWESLHEFVTRNNRVLRLMWIADETIPSDRRLTIIVNTIKQDDGSVMYRTVPLAVLQGGRDVENNLTYKLFNPHNRDISDLIEGVLNNSVCGTIVIPLSD